MKQNIIDKKVFDQREIYSIMMQELEILLEMRCPDLEYLVLNSFENLVKKDFFISQEILYGKSLCDISLSDPR